MIANRRAYDFKSERYEKAFMYVQKCIHNCSMVIGADHPLTAQLNVDMANTLLKMDHREEALRFLEKAFEVYHTSKINDNMEKAEMASQISSLLYDFGAYSDCVAFADKSNEILQNKEDLKNMVKVMLNNKIIAQAKSKMGDYSDAIKRAENLYNTVTKPAVWNAMIVGQFLVGACKIIFDCMVRELNDKKSVLYFIVEMLHSSFRRTEPSTDLSTIEYLKQRCDDNKNPSTLISGAFSDISSRDNLYSVNTLVNVTYDQFIAKAPEASKEGVERTMTTMRLLYEVIGYEFLIDCVKPVA